MRPSGSGVSAHPHSEEGLVQLEECMKQPLPRLDFPGWSALKPEGWRCVEAGKTGEARGGQQTPGYIQEVWKIWQPPGTSPKSYSPGRWCPTGLILPSQMQGLAFALVELHPPLVPFPKLAWGPPAGSSAQDIVCCLLEEKWSMTTG